MKYKIEWFFIGFLVLVLIIAIIVDYKMQSEVFDKVKSGEYQLACKLSNDGYIVVDKEKVIDRYDDIWIFTNGYSKTCKILKD